MTDTSKKALIALLGVAILVLGYMYIFKPAKEDVDSLKTECDTLQTRLDDLIAKESQKDRLLAETDEYNKRFEEVLKYYPADLKQEAAVMFLKSVEENNEFVNNSWSMPEESVFYTLGQNTNTDEVSVSEDALSGENTGKQAYQAVSTSYGVTYSGAYQGLKDVLKYVADYRYRMNISNFTISHDETTDKYSGQLTLNAYAITGPDRTSDPVDPGVPAGTNNLFIAGDGSSSSSSAASKYDADQGESIKSSNDLAILLSSANSDISAGVIVASNANRDETYVTSNDNARAELTLSVYAEDGKNYVEYSIGDKKYVAEILSEDLKVYVKSSARVDASDVNGVDVTVKNTTTLPVYFKVTDDDATAPRFKLAGRSGVVKVY